MFDEDELRALLREEILLALEDKIQDLREALPKPQSKMMTRHQVAKELGIGLSTVDYWTRTGKLLKVKVGERAVRFERAQIEALIEKRRVKRTS